MRFQFTLDQSITFTPKAAVAQQLRLGVKVMQS